MPLEQVGSSKSFTNGPQQAANRLKYANWIADDPPAVNGQAVRKALLEYARLQEKHGEAKDSEPTAEDVANLQRPLLTLQSSTCAMPSLENSLAAPGFDWLTAFSAASQVCNLLWNNVQPMSCMIQ